ncbi:MAG TPA: sulfatase [Planctomycetota bacterium]|nr:sulfatase [Planctomycetota bacterium]
MSTDRPNVLWIMADQLRPQALGCHGDPNARSPRLDRLAAQGAACERAFTPCSVCMPARAALVTGQYGHRNGLRVHGDFLPPDRRTIAHAFRQAGYRTSYVGKLHLASTNSNWTTGEEFWVHPDLRAGFEDFFGFDLSNHYYNTHYCTGDTCRGLKIEGHQTDGLTDLTLRYLAEVAFPSGRPWFHVISYEAPHPGGGNGSNRYMPFPAPPEFEALFDPQTLRLRPNVPEAKEEAVRARAAGYYAMIAHLDHNVGRILDLLDERRQSERTLVVFLSDHGEMLGSHGRFNKEVPYDEAIRIPLLVRLPDAVPAGSRYAGIVSLLDIYPTCAALCGVDPASDVQGVDHSAALAGRARPPRTEALIQWLGKTRYGWGDYPYRAVRTARYTYSVSAEDVDRRNGAHFRLLFDNQRDEHQLLNLFGKAESRGLQRGLHQRLCKAILESGEELPDFVIADRARSRTR